MKRTVTVRLESDLVDDLKTAAQKGYRSLSRQISRVLELSLRASVSDGKQSPESESVHSHGQAQPDDHTDPSES